MTLGDVSTGAGPGSGTRAADGLPGRRPDLGLDALDAGAERAEALVDAFVPLVDLVDGADRRASLRAQARHKHRHTGADVAALHALAKQLRRPAHDDAVRIAEDDPCAHRHELVREEEPALEHLLEDTNRSERLRRNRDRDRRQVSREGGPGPVLDLGDVAAEVVLDDELLIRGNADARLSDLDAQTEPLERRQDRDEVLRLDLLDRYPASGHPGEADERRDLDVVGADPPLAAAKRVDA